MHIFKGKVRSRTRYNCSLKDATLNAGADSSDPYHRTNVTTDIRSFIVPWLGTTIWPLLGTSFELFFQLFRPLLQYGLGSFSFSPAIFPGILFGSVDYPAFCIESDT